MSRNSESETLRVALVFPRTLFDVYSAAASVILKFLPMGAEISAWTLSKTPSAERVFRLSMRSFADIFDGSAPALSVKLPADTFANFRSPGCESRAGRETIKFASAPPNANCGASAALKNASAVAHSIPPEDMVQFLIFASTFVKSDGISAAMPAFTETSAKNFSLPKFKYRDSSAASAFTLNCDFFGSDTVPFIEIHFASAPAAKGFIGENGNSATSKLKRFFDFGDISFVARFMDMGLSDKILAVCLPFLSNARNENFSRVAVSPSMVAEEVKSIEMPYSARFATEYILVAKGVMEPFADNPAAIFPAFISTVALIVADSFRVSPAVSSAAALIFARKSL